ncbi:MAG: LytTR family DNA-binding domain-containing protein [Ferruginibacter sp.]
MRTLKTIIIDDEIDCVRLLAMELQHFTEVSVAATYTDASVALQEIELIKPDLLFLDIEMPVMSGFELIEKIKHLNINIVFVTAYNQFAIKAFRFNALDYLLKPVEQEDLKATIAKALESKKPSQDQLNMLQKQLRGEPVDKIAIPSYQGISFISLNDILYAESSNNYTNLLMVDKKKLLISKTLKEVQTVLEDSHFLRIHRQYIINLNHVKQLNKNDSIVTMINNDELPVARTQKELLIDKYKWF